MKEHELNQCGLTLETYCDSEFVTLPDDGSILPTDMSERIKELVNSLSQEDWMRILKLGENIDFGKTYNQK